MRVSDIITQLPKPEALAFPRNPRSFPDGTLNDPYFTKRQINPGISPEHKVRSRIQPPWPEQTGGLLNARFSALVKTVIHIQRDGDGDGGSG